MFQGSKATYLVTTRNRGLQRGQAATRLTLSASVITSARNQADLRYFKAVAWKAHPTVPEEDKMVGPRLVSCASFRLLCSRNALRRKLRVGFKSRCPAVSFASTIICHSSLDTNIQVWFQDMQSR